MSQHIQEVFDDADQQLIVQGLHALRERKAEALAVAASEPNTSIFTAKDFGLPQIDALIARFGEEPSDDDTPSIRP